MYLKDRFKIHEKAACTRRESELPWGALLVVMTMLGTILCILSVFVYGLGVGLRLLLAETLVLFGVLWTMGGHTSDETAQHD
jgi:hypothetical protein